MTTNAETTGTQGAASAGTAPATDDKNRTATGEQRRGLTAEEQEIANRAERRERKRREQVEAELDQLKKEREDEQRAKLSEDEKKVQAAIEKVKKETADGLLSTHRAEKLGWRVERELLERGADPDGARLMDLKDLDPDDAEAIKDAVDKLLEVKPHLILKGGEQGQEQSARPAGGFPQRTSRVQQGRWSRTRIREVMTAGEYPKYKAEIKAAEREGRISED